MYSQTILTDSNFDEELEKLCTSVGANQSSYNSFVDKLDDGFELQMNDGKEEWVRSRVVPDIESDCRQAHQKGQLAYEFGNGFIVLDFEVLL